MLVVLVIPRPSVCYPSMSVCAWQGGGAINPFSLPLPHGRVVEVRNEAALRWSPMQPLPSCIKCTNFTVFHGCVVLFPPPFSPHGGGVLYRRQVTGRAFQAAMRERKIPFNVHGVAFYRKKALRNVLALLRLSLPALVDNTAARRVWKLLFSREKDEAKKAADHVEQRARDRGCSFLEAAETIFSGKVSGRFTRKQLRAGASVLTTIRIARNLLKTVSAVLFQLAPEVSLTAFVDSIIKLIPEARQFLIDDISAFLSLHTPKPPDTVANDETTCRNTCAADAATSCFPPSVFSSSSLFSSSSSSSSSCAALLRAFLDYVAAREAQNNAVRRKENEDSVTLTTMHQSKGLEWHTVFIVSAIQGSGVHTVFIVGASEGETPTSHSSQLPQYPLSRFPINPLLLLNLTPSSCLTYPPPQSKGLEWHTVFIVSVNEGETPLQNRFEEERGGSVERGSVGRANGEGSEEEPLSLEEERRLFYVAMTRARHRLVIVTLRQTPEKQVLQPSRFIQEIPSNLLLWQGNAPITAPVASPASARPRTPAASYPDGGNEQRGAGVATRNLGLGVVIGVGEGEGVQEEEEGDVEWGKGEGGEEEEEMRGVGGEEEAVSEGVLPTGDFLKSFPTDHRAIIAAIFHSWARRPAFQQPSRLLAKVRAVVDSRQSSGTARSAGGKEALRLLRPLLSSTQAASFAAHVRVFKDSPFDPTVT
ncbi:unnamed protein product [Closterium sp. NIES-65]|nr:unnamed protein product [Closterium sp. NIES-65]